MRKFKKKIEIENFVSFKGNYVHSNTSVFFSISKLKSLQWHLNIKLRFLTNHQYFLNFDYFSVFYGFINQSKHPILAFYHCLNGIFETSKYTNSHYYAIIHVKNSQNLLPSCSNPPFISFIYDLWPPETKFLPKK